MRNHRGLLLASIPLLLLFSPKGFAQQASSFEQLQVLVQKGDQITVTTSDGKVTNGRVEVSGSSLRLLNNRTPIELPEANVREIKKKDPIGNGTKTGAIVGVVVGAGLGILGAAAFCDFTDCGLDAVGGVALMTGLSAGVGAGIGALGDAVTNRNPVVYRAQQRTTSRIRIAPLLSAQRRGVRLSLSF